MVAALVVVAWAGMECRRAPGPAARRLPQATQPTGLIRQAAVAGLFYPKDPRTLSATVDALLAEARPPAKENVRALICPHAGYEYSGPTAAFGYKLLAGRDVRTVILLAPTHYAELIGAYIPQVSGYATPLGTVRISPKAAALAQAKCFAGAGRWRVHRPDWWRLSPQTIPAFGEDTPDTWEHSGEVQVPFLQKVLGDFELIPVIVGQVDAKDLADAIEPQLDETTVVVASSDLSHYHTYDQAQAKDHACVEAICNLDIAQATLQEACGRTPILTVMHLAGRRGWQPTLLDCRSSGDTTGDKGQVVGYASIAFCATERTAPMNAPTTAPENLSDSERKFLLDLARRTVRQAVTAGDLPKVDRSGLSNRLAKPTGCFVTLTQGGRLRGCIGHILPQRPLAEAVVDTARSAALDDPRFPPVTPAELGELHIEISVLTVPQGLAFSSPQDLTRKLRPGRDGVILKIGPRMATYLPQVWEQLPGTEEFLSNLAQKAGCPANAWKGSGVEVQVYQVEAFEEERR
ncbi:MAG: AmmeMemoRadiSam system protein B [Phycisphaerae bacterium]|nr:AmmeMemoRadiSam system protein B [Phycisphaerae bacterium]